MKKSCPVLLACGQNETIVLQLQLNVNLYKFLTYNTFFATFQLRGQCILKNATSRISFIAKHLDVVQRSSNALHFFTHRNVGATAE